MTGSLRRFTIVNVETKHTLIRSRSLFQQLLIQTVLTHQGFDFFFFEILWFLIKLTNSLDFPKLTAKAVDYYDIKKDIDAACQSPNF